MTTTNIDPTNSGMTPLEALLAAKRLGNGSSSNEKVKAQQSQAGGWPR
jgi:hypothetical protein